MRTYKIFIKAPGKVKAVKIGWNWPACFFVGLWALWHGLWVWFLIAIVAISVANLLPAEANIAAQILIMIFYGQNGNTLIEKKLLRKGWTLAGQFAAYNKSDAVHKFLQILRNEEVHYTQTEIKNWEVK